LKVLVVDCDLHSLHTLVQVLEQNGYEPLGAGSYEEGKRLWMAERPPVLIADVRLEQFNGLQLLLLARADRPDLQEIITCPFEDKTLEAETHRFGGTFLVKPLTPDEVLAALPRRYSGVVAGDGAGNSPRLDAERRTIERRQMLLQDFSPERRLQERRRREADLRNGRNFQ
jgi:DNA-binding response OmpR family regulator